MNARDIKSLMADLNCNDIIVCQKARRDLVAMGHEAVPALTKALDDKKRWVRWEAAKALAQIGDPAATASLIKALEDKEFDVRWLAAEGLIRIGRKAVLPLLQRLIDNPKPIWLRQGAHHVLHDMDRGEWDEILRPIMEVLESVGPPEDLPIVARKAIETLTTKSRVV